MFNKFQKKKKNWIQSIGMKKGALHKELGVKEGSKIPPKKLAAAAKKGGKIGKRAQLAETLKGLRKGKKKRKGNPNSPANYGKAMASAVKNTQVFGMPMKSPKPVSQSKPTLARK